MDQVVGRSAELAAPEPAFEGEVVLRMWDMFDGSTRITQHLRGAGEEVELHLPPGLSVDRGAFVRAFGEYVGDHVLDVEDLEVVSPAPEPLIDPDPRDARRIAAIIVFWDSPGLQNGTAAGDLFVGDHSTNVFYQENSYGREKMAGDVFGPYQIPDPGGCDPQAIAQSAQQAFMDHGHDPTEFKQFMYHFPSIPSCGFGGLADIGSPDAPARDSWYNGEFGCTVRNQEIGHNYGMGHSHSYACQDDNMQTVPYSTNCTYSEYGDQYDPMGSGCGHMNVIQKTFMGWIQDCNVLTATADGTFNLMPVELPCNGTQALRFPTFDGRFYWLEYRTPIGGFDGPAGQQGVLLHVSNEVGGGGPNPYILDVGQNGFLHQGDTFDDLQGAVSFTVMEENDGYAVIQATFPSGGSGSPTCRDGSAPGMDMGNVGSMECASQPIQNDTTPPMVQITYPEDGAYFKPGASFTITADASDDRGLTRLILHVKDGPTYDRWSEPWAWEVNGIPAGDYVFQVVARDGPNSANSNVVTIHVTNDKPPPSDTGTGSSGGQSTSTTGMTISGTGGPTGGPGSTGGGSGTGTDGTGPMVNGGGGGCGCRSQGPASGSGLLLLVLGVGLARRRRRAAS